MKIKTGALEAVALDWAVADVLGWMCDGNALEYIEDPDIVVIHTCTDWDYEVETEQFSPSRIWGQGGPLIERYGVTLMSRPARNGGISHWHAQVGPEEPENGTLNTAESPLVAACRAIVAAKLGDEVEIPEDLL